MSGQAAAETREQVKSCINKAEIKLSGSSGGSKSTEKNGTTAKKI